MAHYWWDGGVNLMVYWRVSAARLPVAELCARWSWLCGTVPREPRRVPRWAALPEVQARSRLESRFDLQSRAIRRECGRASAFAAADEVEPQILLLDEVHETLDHEFRAVLEQRAAAILSSGGVVVAAGHDHPMLETLCDLAIWLGGGTVFADGSLEHVRQLYLEKVDLPANARPS